MASPSPPPAGRDDGGCGTSRFKRYNRLGDPPSPVYISTQHTPTSTTIPLTSSRSTCTPGPELTDMGPTSPFGDTESPGGSTSPLPATDNHIYATAKYPVLTSCVSSGVPGLEGLVVTDFRKRALQRLCEEKRPGQAKGHMTVIQLGDVLGVKIPLKNTELLRELYSIAEARGMPRPSGPGSQDPNKVIELLGLTPQEVPKYRNDSTYEGYRSATTVRRRDLLKRGRTTSSRLPTPASDKIETPSPSSAAGPSSVHRDGPFLASSTLGDPDIHVANRVDNVDNDDNDGDDPHDDIHQTPSRTGGKRSHPPAPPEEEDKVLKAPDPKRRKLGGGEFVVDKCASTTIPGLIVTNFRVRHLRKLCVKYKRSGGASAGGLKLASLLGIKLPLTAREQLYRLQEMAANNGMTNIPDDAKEIIRRLALRPEEVPVWSEPDLPRDPPPEPNPSTPALSRLPSCDSEPTPEPAAAIVQPILDIPEPNPKSDPPDVDDTALSNPITGDPFTWDLGADTSTYWAEQADILGGGFQWLADSDAYSPDPSLPSWY